MKNFIRYTVSILALSTAPVLAEFNDPGTDYTVAPQERWAEDESNDYIGMADSMACIMADARTDVMHNATYETMISEVGCGLADEALDESGNSNRGTLSSTFVRTSRGSDDSDQEGTFWFDAQGNARYIGNMVLKKNAAALPPYGEWSMSLYLNSTNSTDDQYTSATSPMTASLEISAGTGDDNGSVIIQTYDKANLSSSFNDTLTSKIQYYDPTGNASRILGRTQGVEFNVPFDRIFAAKTSENYMYKVGFPDGILGAADPGVCLNRQSSWQSGHEYGVYNKATGAALNISGGFGFDYEESDGSAYRGYIDNWGVNFDLQSTNFNANTAANRTKSVTAQNEASTPYTLNWAPGRLHIEVTNSEALSTSGINYFRKRVSSGVNAEVQIVSIGGVFQATYWYEGNQITDPFAGVNNDTIIKEESSATNAGIEDHPWIGEMFSEEKRTHINWDGGTSISFVVSTEVSSDTTLLAASTTPFTGTRNFAPVSNLPIEAGLFNSSDNPWGYADKDDSIDDLYYFTGMNPPHGKLARTLYTDPTGDGSVNGTRDDKPVMFKFSAYDSVDLDGNRKIKYTTFDTTPKTGDFTNDNVWPFFSIDLKSADNTLYRWNFSAFLNDNSVIATNAEDAVHTIEPPVNLKYEHAATKDMNENQEIIYFTDAQDHQAARALCAALGTSTRCEVGPTDFGTREYNLEYNGNWLSGLPSMMGRSSATAEESFWLRLINPKAGTIVTGLPKVNGADTKYVLKPLKISSKMLPATTADCTAAGLFFTDESSFGWELSDLTTVPVVPLPTTTWAQKPTTAQLECTVTGADTSACPQ